MRYKLQSFEESTTEEYIKFRLKIAGSTSELFTKDAMEAVHSYSHLHLRGLLIQYATMPC